jgi:UDP-3-O-[3-hydroxymyristoyl] glucosamine N-acyltransferase
MPITAAALAKSLGAKLIGKSQVSLSAVAGLSDAGTSDLIFVEDANLLPAALKSRAGAVLAGEFAANQKATKPLLIALQPRLAFARAARLLQPPAHHPARVHPSALVRETAKLGKEVGIGPHALVGHNCVIGPRTVIAANCYVDDGVKLGADCRIGPNVTIHSGTAIGDRVHVQAGAVLGSTGFGYVRDADTGHYEQFPQIGRLEIGDDVEIGTNVTIDRGALEATVIGRGVKIDNLVHIAHNVQIGENVVIAALTGISGSSVVEKNVIVGGQVGIGDHARITEGVILGSGSGVLTKKIVRGKGVVFWGRPAKPLKEYLRELAMLSKLAKK